MALEEPRQGRGRSGNAALNQTGAKFLKALVTLLLERRHDDRVPRLDPSGPRVAALRLRGEAARLPARRVPADHRRHRHPEATRRRATAHPAIHGRKRPRPQIHGKWPAHPVTPITASRARNQTSANLGILVTDSNRKGDALNQRSMLTMNFQIKALPETEFANLLEMTDAELAECQACRQIVNAKPGTPCRVSMADAEIGETVLLLNYAHQPEESPYQATHAIFVRKDAKQATIAVNEVPEVIRSRLISVRLFDSKHMMVDADVVAGDTAPAVISKAF